jgi:hypothetical protein
MAKTTFRRIDTMKRSTTRWTTAAAAAALLGLPAAGLAQTTQQPPSTQQPPTSSTTAQQPPATTSQPPTSTQPPTGTEPTATQPPTGTEPTATEPQSAHVDQTAAKQALSDARDSLAQLASLPQAAQLQGDTRTKVSQLISNFNELITTQANWRSSYGKVEQSLNGLIGDENQNSTEPSAAGESVATGTSGTATGAATEPTGTTGTTGAEANAAAKSELDPAIRAKLIEFRTHLKEFERAAGGAEQQTPASSPTSSMSPAVSTSSASNPANPETATEPETASSAMQQTPTSAAQTPATAEPQAAGTEGAVGTSGTMTSANRAQADQELDAIQTILSQAKNGRLDKTEVDQLKAHVAQLRQLLGQSR